MTGADVRTREEEAQFIEWMRRSIFPREQEVRRWLRRTTKDGREDDVIQEAYCRLAALPDPCSIAQPRAYFFQVARSIVLEQFRRDRVVRIDCVAEIDRLRIVDATPSPERVAACREELVRVARIIGEMPMRRRMIFTMRKVEGLSQREISQRMGVTENVVEKEIAAGVRDLVRTLSADSSRWASSTSHAEVIERRDGAVSQKRR